MNEETKQPSLKDQVRKQWNELPKIATDFTHPYLDRLVDYSNEIRIVFDSINLFDMRYQAASESEKNFIAIKYTFESAKERLQNEQFYKRSYLPLAAKRINETHTKEIERLHEPIHPLMELALEAWKNRPTDIKTSTPEIIEEQLRGMLRIALLETQHHIEEVKDRTKASRIILDTQKALIDVALEVSSISKEPGKGYMANEVEGMLTLAFNLSSDKDELVKIKKDKKLNNKQHASMSERVLFEDTILIETNIYDPKTPKSRYVLEESESIDLLNAFSHSIKSSDTDPQKSVRKYIHEAAIKLPQQLIFMGIGAEQAMALFPKYIQDRTSQNTGYSIYDFVLNVSTGKASTVTEQILMQSILQATDGVDEDWMRENTLQNELFQNAITETLQYAIDRKSAIVEAMANLVKRKLPKENEKGILDTSLAPSEQLTHAGKIAEELFDDMASVEFIGTLQLSAKKIHEQLTGRLKAFKDLFNSSHRRGQYLKTLLSVKPKGARLQIAPYKESLISPLVDGGKRAPYGLSTAHTQALAGSVAAHWDSEIQMVSGMQIFNLITSHGDAEQMKNAINAMELRNSRHALKEVFSEEYFQIPSIAVVPEKMDKSELSALNKVYASYIIEQIDREQKMWTGHKGEISSDMWEFQRFALNLLATEEKFELNGVTYVPNKELDELLAKKVIEITLLNLQKALNLDKSYPKGTHPNFDAFMEVLQITVPFMAIETKKYLVERYSLEALNFAGDFVTDGKWKQFCFSIGFWIPSLLPGLKGTAILKPEEFGKMPVIQDKELMQTLVDETIKIAAGWKHINGITSMQLLAELESMHSRSHKVENPVTHLKTSALAQFIDIIRNFSTYEEKDAEDKLIVEDTSIENYKKLNETVKSAVILTIMRRFKADIPRDPEIIGSHIKKLDLQAKAIRKSISDSDVQTVEDAFDNIRKSLTRFQDKLNEFVPTIQPLDQTRAIMDAMIANRSAALIASSPLGADDLEAAARVTGEDVARNLALSLANQIQEGLLGSGMTTEVKRALQFVFSTFGGDVTLQVHKAVSILSKISALSTHHKAMAELQSVANEQTSHLAHYVAGVDVEGITENPALRALEFYNRTAPLLGYDRIEEAELMMQAWTQSTQNLYPEMKKERPEKKNKKN